MAWIYVKERLPDPDRRVLVAYSLNGSGFVREAYHLGAWWAPGRGLVENVYAWCEMLDAPPPEPPKESP